MGRETNGQQDLFIEAPVWWEGLTGSRRLFVEHYCTDRTCFLNATAAYIKAFGRHGKEPTEQSIQSNSSRLLRDPKVQAAISKLLRARQSGEDRLNEYRLLETLQQMAFYNPAEIIDEYGNLIKPINQMGTLALCVSGIEKTKHGKRIKLYDRTKAMEMLGRYLDVIRPVEGTTVINPVVALTDKDIEKLRNEAEASAKAEDAEFEVMGAQNLEAADAAAGAAPENDRF